MSSSQKLEGQIITQEKPQKPSEVVERMLLSRREQFIKALPSHISFDKFQRTVMMAVLTDPGLLQADRHTLMVSCLKAAGDGLLPDKREAAFVIFNTKAKDDSGKEVWIKAVQYMPMYLGVMKKVRQSGELASVLAHVVYQRDEFNYVLGDEERIEHKPYMGSEARGPIIAAYSIATLKDGTVIREVMTFEDIEKVRKVSKSGADKDTKAPIGIWKDWYPEMARKTVFRRLSKWLPQSIDIIDQAFENDDSMEVLDQVEGSDPVYAIEEQAAPAQISDQSDQPDLAAEIEKTRKKKDKVPVDVVDKSTGEVTEDVSKAIEKEDPPKETDFDFIKRSLMEAKDGDEVYYAWASDPDVEAAKKLISKEDMITLTDLYKSRSREFEGK